MKIRSDFVTNSSTASYVLLGFEIPEDFDFAHVLKGLGESGFLPDEAEALFYEVVQKQFDAGVLYGNEGGLEDDTQRVVGVYLGAFYSDDYPKSKVKDLVEFVKPVMDLHRKVGASTPIKVYIGAKNS